MQWKIVVDEIQLYRKPVQQLWHLSSCLVRKLISSLHKYLGTRTSVHLSFRSWCEILPEHSILTWACHNRTTGTYCCIANVASDSFMQQKSLKRTVSLRTRLICTTSRLHAFLCTYVENHVNQWTRGTRYAQQSAKWCTCPECPPTWVVGHHSVTNWGHGESKPSSEKYRFGSVRSGTVMSFAKVLGNERSFMPFFPFRISANAMQRRSNDLCVFSRSSESERSVRGVIIQISTGLPTRLGLWCVVCHYRRSGGQKTNIWLVLVDVSCSSFHRKYF